MKNLPGHVIRDYVFKRTSKTPTGMKGCFMNIKDDNISKYNSNQSYLRSEYKIHSRYGFDLLKKHGRK